MFKRFKSKSGGATGTAVAPVADPVDLTPALAQGLFVSVAPEAELTPAESQELANAAEGLNAGNEMPAAEAPKSAAAELIESQGADISTPSIPDSQPAISKNLRGEDAVVAGRFDLKAGEGQLEVSLVGNVDDLAELDLDLVGELFKVMKSELAGKDTFELQFARRIQAGNFVLMQQGSSAPDFRADYKVRGLEGKEMPFRLVIIQARSEQRRSEVVAAAAAGSTDARRDKVCGCSHESGT
jgi:hypothetical protein